MRHIIYTIGKPPDNLLGAGLFTTMYFNVNYEARDGVIWKFKVRLTVHFYCSFA